jgi:hypothetical protein
LRSLFFAIDGDRRAPVPAYGTVLPVNGTAIAALAAVALPAASAVLLTLDLSNPYSAFVLHSSSMFGACARLATVGRFE